ncbi:MAG: PLD nuclease N-terminal domain-containing protein [Candidatus Nanopelagicales bacterium]
MGRFLLYVIPAVVVLYALIDALQTPRGLERTLPKWLWLVVIILIPLLGAIAWLIWGRAPRSAYADGSTARRVGRSRAPVAPDDDPRFLRQLEDEAWQRKMRERRDGGAAQPPAGPDAPAPPATRRRARPTVRRPAAPPRTPPPRGRGATGVRRTARPSPAHDDGRRAELGGRSCVGPREGCTAVRRGSRRVLRRTGGSDGGRSSGARCGPRSVQLWSASVAALPAAVLGVPVEVAHDDARDLQGEHG